MFEAHEPEAPVYSFSYKPSKRDIRSAAVSLNSRRRWTDNRTKLIIQGALILLAVVGIVLVTVFDSREMWSGGAGVGAIIVLLLHIASEIETCVQAVYGPECVKDYMRDRKADADRLQTYTFYDDRVEIEGPSGRLTHAYEAYDRLVLTPDMFFCSYLNTGASICPGRLCRTGSGRLFGPFCWTGRRPITFL